MTNRITYGEVWDTIRLHKELVSPAPHLSMPIGDPTYTLITPDEIWEATQWIVRKYVPALLRNPKLYAKLPLALKDCDEWSLFALAGLQAWNIKQWKQLGPKGVQPCAGMLRKNLPGPHAMNFFFSPPDRKLWFWDLIWHRDRSMCIREPSPSDGDCYLWYM